MGIMFAPDMLAAVLEGRKTQTRRRVKLNEFALAGPNTGGEIIAVEIDTEKPPSYRRNKWGVGKTEALLPGRGKMTAYYKRNDDGTISYYDWKSAMRVQGAKAKKSLALAAGYDEGRVLTTRIRRERFCDISQADAVAEGFDNPAGFFAKIRELYGDDFDLTQPCWILEFRLV